MRFICGITSILSVFLLILPAYSLSFKTLKVFKLSAADQSAVVRVEDGALKLVTVGQALDPYGKITAIGQDRIIFERIGAQGKEIYILRVEENRQQVQKITRAAGHERKGVKSALVERKGVKSALDSYRFYQDKSRGQT